VDVERLRRLPWFGDLDHHDLALVARWVHAVEVPEGAYLIEEGALPYDLLVIEEGTAEAVRGDEFLGTLGPGDVVGEIGVLLQEKRTASVRATSPLRAIALAAEDVRSLEAEMPEVAASIRVAMEERLRANRDD
jgi:CRP/FNR family cyclic AMP-dependent transcriptional regulator